MMVLHAEDDGELDAFSSTVVSAVDRIAPSVVKIETKLANGSHSGSGFVFTHDGFVITNAHVVQGGTAWFVSTSEGTTHRADMIGMDSDTDVAVIRIHEDVPPPAELGTSARLRVGQFVLAVGNPLGFDHSVTS